MDTPETTTVISARVSAELAERIDRLAKSRNQTRQAVLLKVINMGIAELEMAETVLAKNKIGRLFSKVLETETGWKVMSALVGESISEEEVKEVASRMRSIQNYHKDTASRDSKVSKKKEK